MDKKSVVLYSVLFLLIFPVTAFGYSEQSCVDEDTLQIQHSKQFCNDKGCDWLNITENIHCDNGCSNNMCKPSTLWQWIIVVVFIVIIISFVWYFLR